LAEPATIVVTGGAGYVGSHTVLALHETGHPVIVVDDLSGSAAAPLPAGVPLEKFDVTEPGRLASLVDRCGARAILHFAARIQVGQSVARPELYYGTNVAGMLRVVEAAQATGAKVVFSSTAAVYGTPETTPIPITHPVRPESPYGFSKRFAEQVLADCARAHGFTYAVLRYFNAAGARAEAGLGEWHSPETHLVPLAIAAALEGPALSIFGDDWPTPDGTCLRDYVHVEDLADAHVRALGHLLSGGTSVTLNLGSGRSSSVREVLLAVERALGRPVPVRVSPRRPGDVSTLVADVSESQRVLGWNPARSTLDRIVADAAAAFRRGHPISSACASRWSDSDVQTQR
jgi:UDP-glucose-4-epimerase GalE